MDRAYQVLPRQARVDLGAMEIVYICKAHNRKQIHRWTLVFSDTNRLLISDFLTSVLRHEERDNSKKSFVILLCQQHLPMAEIQLYFSTPWSDPTSPNHHCKTQTSTVCVDGRQPNCLPTWSTVNSELILFSKSSNSQDHRFWAWRHSHTSHIFYLGFIMTIVIVISFAR